jgi:hypothetical protein
VFAGGRLQRRWIVEALANVARSECAEIAALAVTDTAPESAPWPLRAYRVIDRSHGR